MAFKYYEEYLSPKGAPEMPEDKRGEEQIDIIKNSEVQGKCSFINLAVLSLTLIFCAMIVFVLRENDYTSLNETNKLDKDSFMSGEYFGSLEQDVVDHLSLRDEIIRANNNLHYFCGIGNKLVKPENDEEEELPDNAFRISDTSVPGGRKNDSEDHEVVTRATTEQTEKTTEKTKKTKKPKKKKTETSVTTAVKIMTSTEPEYTTTTTTTTKEETTTTKATKNTAPDFTTKVTTEPTKAPATTTKKKTTKATTEATTKATTESTTEVTSSETEAPPETGGEEPDPSQDIE